MTRADERPPGTYPWHRSAASVAGPAARAAVRGRRAGLITRSLANVADLGVVVLVVAGGYVAVAAARFLLRPASFSFPTPQSSVLLLIGLGVQAVYFAITWSVVGGTYGDRLLGLRVADDRGARLGWGRSTLRAGLCTVLPIGLLWVLISGENRSVQDLLLRTSVVYD